MRVRISLLQRSLADFGTCYCNSLETQMPAGRGNTNREIAGGPSRRRESGNLSIYPAVAAEVTFRERKHSRQYTGRPCVGLNGTVVSLPHCEQVVMVSVLVKPEPEEPWRLVLQFLHRFGSFLKFLSWKKCCSPAVNTKSAEQSTHLRTRS